MTTFSGKTNKQSKKIKTKKKHKSVGLQQLNLRKQLLRQLLFLVSLCPSSLGRAHMFFPLFSLSASSQNSNAYVQHMVKSYLNCGEKFRPEFVRHRVEICDEHVNPVLYSADNWNYVWADSIQKSALKEKQKNKKNKNKKKKTIEK